MEKEMKIIPPVGYEIDKENSTFDCIKFKPVKQELTYEDVCEKIKPIYLIGSNGHMESFANSCCYDKNHAPTKEQLEKVLAINQLQNIANYYNKGWKPNWNDTNEDKFLIFYGNMYNKYYINCNVNDNYGLPVFKNKEDAQAVIDNPNFREILNKIYKS